MDNFGLDPFARVAMVDTAENVARKWGITLEEQHEVTLQRYAQYGRATAGGSAFLKRFMTLPFEVPDARYKKTAATIDDGDEGVFATTREGLAKLKPVKEGGTVTYGSQTHPADGGAALLVTTRERAAELSRERKTQVKILGFGQARVEPAFMPAATIPAARRALAAACLEIGQIDVVKSHNPFAVNDIVFAREMGIDVMAMNDYGSSLVWGHPQGPTGLRAIIELIEQLALRGGGRGLFFGCAAGDSAMAAVIEVTG